MKNTIKTIIIAAEAVLIVVLSLFLFYTCKENKNKAVQTMGDGTDIDYSEIERKVADNYYGLSGKKILMDIGTYGEIMIPAIESVPAFSKDKEMLRNRNGRMYYIEGEQVKSILGVDVSVHQGDINWEKVKESGISFAMIRLGYRGYGTGESEIDEKFVENVKGAREAGINAGVYFFSQAITAREAVEEAELVIKNLKDLDINYPVVFDWEMISEDSARTDNISVDILTDCCVAFCETIKNAGYTPMIYQNKRTSIFKLDLNRLNDYEFWLAEYNDTPSYYYDFDMWQYTSSGRVPGIKGRVDMNISFKDYSK